MNFLFKKNLKQKKKKTRLAVPSATWETMEPGENQEKPVGVAEKVITLIITPPPAT